MNWGRHSERNHDYVLQSRVVADVDRLALVFEQDWALAGGHPAPLPAWSGPVAQTGPGSGIRILLEAGLRRAGVSGSRPGVPPARPPGLSPPLPPPPRGAGRPR